MTKVFFGGSRGLRHLNDDLKARTDNIIKKKYQILVGDANGADKVMQQYLAENNYLNVTVYCMEDGCRNNIGDWKTRNIHTDRKTKDFKYFCTKDMHMSEDADYGFMLWDGKSKGTLNNIINLCERSKQVLVYYMPRNCFYTIESFKDVSILLENCDRQTLNIFDKTININSRIFQKQQSFNFNGNDITI